MRPFRSSSKSRPRRRKLSGHINGRATSRRQPIFESLETRGMLTTLILSVQDPFLNEVYGAGATYGELTRFDEDLSQPLEVFLSSSDETEIVVPVSVIFPADETTVYFPIDAVDDTSLDGEQLVFIAATTGTAFADAALLVQDYESASIAFDQTALQSGDTLTGTATISLTDHTEPVFVTFVSSRPDEIASIVAEIPAGEQSVDIAVPVLADGHPEGPHAVQFSLSYDSGLFADGTYIISVSDPGVTTLQPVDDGQARDIDQDGTVFESVATNFHSIVSQAAAPNGTFGESRGILEFDTSSLPGGAVIQSAVLTLDIDGASYSPGTNPVMDVFAFAGNGLVESADANQIATAVGQLSVPTDDFYVLGSYAVALDVPTLQALINDGGYLGITTKMQASSLSFHSKEFFRSASRPSLHLVLANPPAITANSLTVGEGETVTLSAANLAATDADSPNETLIFTVSNVSNGQFLVAGTPAMSFTQAQIAAGEVAFVHDGGEFAPSYSVEVGDGAFQDGPLGASIAFSNVNDNAPDILGGQTFSASESAVNGTMLGTVTFSDADLPADSLSASITAGNVGGMFAIDNSGTLTVANNAQLDYESATSYTLTISVSDGVNTTNQTVTVDVLDVAETKFYVVDDASHEPHLRVHRYRRPGRKLHAQQRQHRPARCRQHRGRRPCLGRRRQPQGLRLRHQRRTARLLDRRHAGLERHGRRHRHQRHRRLDRRCQQRQGVQVHRRGQPPSGSQNAASSFNLNSGNTSPEGHRHRRHVAVGRQQHVDRQGVQVHARRQLAGQLDDRLGQFVSDRHHDRPGERRATSGSSTAAPTASTSTTARPAARPAARPPPSASPWPPATPIPQGIADPPPLTANVMAASRVSVATVSPIRQTLVEWSPLRSRTQIRRAFSEPEGRVRTSAEV